jgi:DME family drug/metabolite transporter
MTRKKRDTRVGHTFQLSGTGRDDIGAEMKRFSKYRGPAYILLAALCFSTTGTVQAFAPAGAQPQVVGAVRLWLGFVFLLIWAWKIGRLPRIKSLRPLPVITAASGIVGYQLCFFSAVLRTGVAVGTVTAIGIAPIAAGILGFIFLHERPAKAWYLATPAAVAGLALLTFSGPVRADPLGLFLAVSAGTFYAAYVVFSRGLVRDMEPISVITALFAVGSLMVAPVFFIYPVQWIFTPRGLAVSLWLGLIATALAYGSYTIGLKTTPASTGVTIDLSECIAATCWSVFLLGETLTMLNIAGMALVLASTLVLTIGSR